MRINPVDPRTLTDADLVTMHEVLAAAAAHDRPAVPVPTRADLGARLRWPWPGFRLACWLGFNDDGPVGVTWVELPGGANASLADLSLAVRPGDRRAGVGRGLLREAVRLAYSLGRSTMVGSVQDGGPGTGFAEALGATPGQREVHALLDVASAVAEVGVAEDSDLAGSDRDDYELVRLRGATPPELLAGVGAVHEGMADAPLADGGRVHQAYDEARVAAVDAVLAARGLLQLRVLARHRQSGDVVGVTYVIVSQADPHHAEQGDTTVLAAHRGRRLGLAMKAEMLRWLAAEFPDVQQLSTWVAADNAPMQALNTRLGYQEAGRWTQWQAPVQQLSQTLGLV